MQDMKAERVVVIGGGPAAAAVAIGLTRLGEAVTVIAQPRRFDAVEGATARSVSALRRLGLESALQAFAPPSPRRARWQGIETARNHESLLDRARFDRGLLADLERLGVPLLRGQVLGIRSEPGRHEVEVEVAGRRRQLAGSFLVEARGRWAPAGGRARVRGAETVSLLQYWQGPALQPHSAVESLADGWAWMAALADGRRYMQLTLDVGSAALPPRAALGDYCRQRFSTIASAQTFVRGAQPVGEPYARASTPILSAAVAGADWIRVGDAAMAVDPLSGNGIFQALSSALQAPAVIASLRRGGREALLAQNFHQQRIDHLFYRFARIGRDFYAQETRWAEQPFWAARRQWPDQQPLHMAVTPAQVHIELRPVVSEGRITEAEVVVTPDQPLGVWHVDGIRLAPLLRAVQDAGPQRDPARLFVDKGGLEQSRAQQLAAWMRAQGWLE